MSPIVTAQSRSLLRFSEVGSYCSPRFMRMSFRTVNGALETIGRRHRGFYAPLLEPAAREAPAGEGRPAEPGCDAISSVLPHKALDLPRCWFALPKSRCWLAAVAAEGRGWPSPESECVGPPNVAASPMSPTAAAASAWNLDISARRLAWPAPGHAGRDRGARVSVALVVALPCRRAPAGRHWNYSGSVGQRPAPPAALHFGTSQGLVRAPPRHLSQVHPSTPPRRQRWRPPPGIPPCVVAKAAAGRCSKGRPGRSTLVGGL